MSFALPDRAALPADAELLESEFDIHHTTLQVEHEPERLLQIE